MSELSSGKGHRDENFPVASVLIAPRHRVRVLAFYRIARQADDIADHPTAPASEKLARLAAIEASVTDRHLLDLLHAFRQDVVKSRYADWDELIDYCRWSAAPVGRFMLDVHGESTALWPASDALCAALQVINHLQDCAKDYRDLNRVYLPQDALAAAGVDVTALGAPAASPALRGVIADLARRCQALLADSRVLAGEVRDLRLSMEIGVIHRLAESLAARLIAGDPLSRRIRHTRLETAWLALVGAAGALGSRGRMGHR